MKVRREKHVDLMTLTDWVDRLPINHPARGEYLTLCEKAGLPRPEGFVWLDNLASP